MTSHATATAEPSTPRSTNATSLPSSPVGSNAIDEARSTARESRYGITRAEKRERTVHVVEYSRYPRRLTSEGRNIAYTQDRSEGGLGLELRERVYPGELLQVTLRDIDGTIAIDGLARVVWCRPSDGHRAKAGLAMLREEGDRPMMRVRRPSGGLHG